MRLVIPAWWRGRWMRIGWCPIRWELAPLVFPPDIAVMLPMPKAQQPQGPVL